jgi:hypothetical protein
MIRLTLAMVCMILSVGAIDGPTGYENDNFGLAFTFAILGIVLGVWSIADKSGAR